MTSQEDQTKDEKKLVFSYRTMNRATRRGYPKYNGPIAMCIYNFKPVYCLSMVEKDVILDKIQEQCATRCNRKGC